MGGIPSHLPALFFHLLHTIYGAPTLPWALCKGSFTNLASANIQTFIFSSRTVFTLKITVLETPPPSPYWTLYAGMSPSWEATETSGCVFGTAAQKSLSERKGAREKLVPSQ